LPEDKLNSELRNHHYFANRNVDPYAHCGGSDWFLRNDCRVAVEMKTNGFCHNNDFSGLPGPGIRLWTKLLICAAESY
jgi:hypothetical protein